VDEPTISYEHLVERALRGVLREALRITLESGLPGEHHFYITFRTGHGGVRIPDHLRAQHPDDMTIVLQHQFWDLEVTDEWFAVSLSFQGRREHLHIPFEAVTAFADPFAKFGLQFQIDVDDDDDDLIDGDEADAFDLPGLAGFSVDDATAPAPEAGAETGDNVVALDFFRKK
jgi:hypothetical protein